MGHALSEKMTHDHSTSNVGPSARGTMFPSGGRKEMMVLIKPAMGASYKNVVGENHTHSKEIIDQFVFCVR